jgi:ABC-type multidrug transport system fused ATPase/permease subunit
MKAAWTKEQIERYNKKIAEMKAEIDAETPQSLAEQIQTAKQGNKETLNNIKENAQNVEKVLEMKKDINKTNAYIKTLEMARAEELKERTTQQQYYVEKKSHFWRNWVIIMLVLWAILILCDTKFFMQGIWAIAISAVVFLPIYLFQVLCNLISNSARFKWSYYKRCKHIIEIVRANNNKIPACFGGKKSYYDYLTYVQEFERDYPQVAALYISELSPEDRAYYERNSL